MGAPHPVSYVWWICCGARAAGHTPLFRGAGLLAFTFRHTLRQGERRIAGDRLGAFAIHPAIAVAAVLLLALLLILLLLLRRGRQDAVIMLGVLEVILRRHAIALRVSIAGELQILVVNVRGGAPDLYLRPVRIEGSVRIVMLAAAAVMGVLRPAAALP